MCPEKGGEFLELPVVDVFVQLGTQFVGQPEIEVLSGELVDDRPLKVLPGHARVDIEEPGFEVDHGVRSQNLVAGPVEKNRQKTKDRDLGVSKGQFDNRDGSLCLERLGILVRDGCCLIIDRWPPGFGHDGLLAFMFGHIGLQGGLLLQLIEYTPGGRGAETEFFGTDQETG